MRRIFMALFLLPAFLQAQPAVDTSWVRVYGSNGDDVPKVIRQTTDGGFVVAGYTTSMGAGGQDAYLLKLDSSGNVEWQRTYGTSNNEVASDVRELHESGFIVAGYAGIGTAFLVRYSQSGDTTWTRIVIGNHVVGNVAIVQTTEGFLLQAPIFQSIRQPLWSFFLNGVGAVLDSAIEYGWAETELTELAEIVVNRAGEIVSLGNSHYCTSFPQNPNHWAFYFECLRRDRSAAHILSSFTYYLGENVWRGSLGIAETNEGNYCVWTNQPALFMLDSSLAHIRWTRSLELGNLTDLVAASTGGCIITNILNGQLWLQRYDSTGAQDMSCHLNLPGQLANPLITRTRDGGYVIATSAVIDTAHHTDIMVVKTGPDQIAFVDKPSQLPTDYAFAAYPNPFNVSTTISFTIPTPGHVNVTVFNIRGESVRVLGNRIYDAGYHRLSFDGFNLSSGVYFAHIFTPHFERTTKLVLLK